jgi:membrane-associated phospholipid phosphatase
VTTRDLWLGLGAAGATALVAANDGWFRDRALEADSQAARSLARAVQPLGNVVVVAPAILLAYATARLSHREPLEHAALRTGVSVGVAGGAALLVKEIVGRDRPSEAPGDPDQFHPFSRHESFPSGHPVVAFATATALTRESGRPWVPWVAYPAAALVGWSRVHDDLHWTSDVVAGAALGIFLTAKTEDFLRRRRFPALGLSVEPRSVGWRVAIELGHP